MKYDLLLAGVGGQGVLSLSSIIAWSAMREGLHVTQSELHGMSQRGGAVVAHLRMADTPVASSLVPRGAASLIVSLEPLFSQQRFEIPPTIENANDLNSIWQGSKCDRHTPLKSENAKPRSKVIAQRSTFREF